MVGTYCESLSVILITIYPCFLNWNTPAQCKKMSGDQGTVQVLGTGLEPNMKKGCMSTFLLSCAGTGLVTCRSPI